MALRQPALPIQCHLVLEQTVIPSASLYYNSLSCLYGFAYAVPCICLLNCEMFFKIQLKHRLLCETSPTTPQADLIIPSLLLWVVHAPVVQTSVYVALSQIDCGLLEGRAYFSFSNRSPVPRTEPDKKRVIHM